MARRINPFRRMVTSSRASYASYAAPGSLRDDEAHAARGGTDRERSRRDGIAVHLHVQLVTRERTSGKASHGQARTALEREVTGLPAREAAIPAHKRRARARREEHEVEEVVLRVRERGEDRVAAVAARVGGEDERRTDGEGSAVRVEACYLDRRELVFQPFEGRGPAVAGSSEGALEPGDDVLHDARVEADARADEARPAGCVPHREGPPAKGRQRALRLGQGAADAVFPRDDVRRSRREDRD